jgi:hypothetical protein
MMFLLRNSEIYQDIVAFDLTDGTWQRVDLEMQNKLGPRGLSGFFALLSSNFCAIFRSGQEIMMCVGGVRISLSKDVKISVSGNRDQRRLVVSKKGEMVVAQVYSLDNWGKIKGDPTPFVEEEDFDFGLLIANIAGSPERQQVFIENNG